MVDDQAGGAALLGARERVIGREAVEQRATDAHHVRAGAPLAFGSDWPVVTINPWLGFHVAVTRQDPEGRPAGLGLQAGPGFRDEHKASHVLDHRGLIGVQAVHVIVLEPAGGSARILDLGA